MQLEIPRGPPPTGRPPGSGPIRDARGSRRQSEQRGLQPRDAVYVSWTKSRRQLRFTKIGDQNLERAYRTLDFTRSGGSQKASNGGNRSPRRVGARKPFRIIRPNLFP
jgi:hypothetical protein